MVTWLKFCRISPALAEGIEGVPKIRFRSKVLRKQRVKKWDSGYREEGLGLTLNPKLLRS